MKSFRQISRGNTMAHGLTELNAFESVNRGFISHPDWFAHLMRYGSVSHFVEKHKPGSILDIGCGDLNLIKFLWRNRSSFAGTYTGADLRATERWLDGVDWQKGDIELVQMDLVKDNPSELNPADLVVCMEVFEHVPRDKQQVLINRLYDWTSPGGHCLFSTPNAGVARSTADNHIGPEGDRERTYTEKLYMCNQAGFEILDTWGVFCGLSRLPKEFIEQDWVKRAKEHLSYHMLVGFLAFQFPEQSNNAMFLMWRPS